MSEPTFDDTTNSIYGDLPDHMLASDKYQNYLLKKYVRSTGKQLDVVEKLIDRFKYVPPDDGGLPGDTSDLVNPLTADARWLPWLAQTLGSNSRYGISGQELSVNTSSLNAGTKNYMIAAAKTALAGDKYVAIHDHSNTAPGNGGQWDMLVVTKDLETLKNLCSTYVATVSSKAVFSVTTTASGGVALNYLSSPSYPVWKNRYLVAQINALSSTWSLMFETADKFPVDASTLYQVHLNARLLDSGTGTKDGYIGFRYYNSSSAVISVNQSPITLTHSDQQFSYRVATPSTAVSCRLFIVSNVATHSDQIGVAQLGLRREAVTTWVPTTADPVKAIIDHGAKPAGVVLHGTTFAASWDALETTYPTMTVLEGHSWGEVEENRP